MTTVPSKLDSLPPDARAFVDATWKLLETYMPGSERIEMMIGPNVKASLSIEGGAWSQQNIGEVIIHLKRYRRFFDETGPDAMNSAQKIMEKLESILADHRAKQAEQSSEG